jgi:RHS repeat-associated protein
LSTDPSTFAQPEQATTIITVTENTFTAPIDEPGAYRTPMPSETKTFQLTTPPRPDDSAVYLFSDLQNLAAAATEIPYEQTPDPALTQLRLIDDTRTVYLANNLSSSMPTGQMDTLGLVYQTFKLALTANLAQQVFIAKNVNPNAPSVANLNATLSSTGIVDAATKIFTNTGGGYVHSQGDGDWWIPSGQTLYSPVSIGSPYVPDPAYAAAHFYLPQAYCDPFNQYTLLSYDSYNLLLLQTQDALGNVVYAQNDYRVLQACKVVDPNQNQTEARFDALGLVVGAAIEGKIASTGASESGDSFASFTVDLAQSVIEGFIGSATPADLAAGLLGTATTRVVYDLHRFRKTSLAHPNDPTQWLPVFAATLARETHASSTSLMQLSFSFSDGFGREIQHKAQAAPGPLDLTKPTSSPADPRWIGSGWTITNNKGKPVRKYEPFFSATQDFEFANKVGVTSTLFYDPLERVTATLHPNQTWEKVVFDAWSQTAWDVNDTVLMDPTADPDVGDLFSQLPASDCLPTWNQQRTGLSASTIWTDPEDLAGEQGAAAEAAPHSDTPTTVVFDVLGRHVLTVAHNRYQNNGATVDEFYQTRSELDVVGNLLSVTDAKGRQVMLYEYDILKTRIHQSSMEAGQRWALNSVGGKPVYAWDSRGFLRVITYDALQRPLSLTVTDGDSKTFVAEKTVYGDTPPAGGGPAAPEQTNLRGKVYQGYDSAGIVTNFGLNPATHQNEGYDFKGNLLRSARALLASNAFQSQVDWSQNPLTNEVFTAASKFDALNRVIQQIAPHSNQGVPMINITQPGYDEGALLFTVDVWLGQTAEPNGLLNAGAATLHAVTDIEYDAKGRRTSIGYGILDTSPSTQVRTSYEYDPETFRLVRLTTSSAGGSGAFQDFRYYYDPIGNITHIQDDAQDTIYFNNTKVDPSSDYLYDAIYRLVSAKGREHLGQSGGAPNAPTPQSYNDWPNIDLPHPNDGNAMGTYTETFGYDPVGNFSQFKHAGSNPANPGWKRTYAYQEPSQLQAGAFSNRLTSTSVGQATELYTTATNPYDAHGNMTRMPQLRAMNWDFKDRLQMTQRQAVNPAEQVVPDMDGPQHNAEQTYYAYGASGQRVIKATVSPTGALIKQRIYLGGFEIYREYDANQNITLERQTLHVMDDRNRVAMIETRKQGKNDKTPRQLIRFQFGSHLGSSCLELNDQGQVISYEEYYPYGGTSYQGVHQSINPALKRYRNTGKERDEESGLYYHEARYYASWLGRWIACDPKGIMPGCNLYVYSNNTPTVLSDPSGRDPNDKGNNQDAPKEPQPQIYNMGPTSPAAIPSNEPLNQMMTEWNTFLQRSSPQTPAGPSLGASTQFNVRARTSEHVEQGLLLSVGGYGPTAGVDKAVANPGSSGGTGSAQYTLHLGDTVDPNNKEFQHAQGDWLTAGLLFGNPSRGDTTPALTYTHAYSLVWGGGDTQVDIDVGGSAQSKGSVNNNDVNGSVNPSVGANVSQAVGPVQVNLEGQAGPNIGMQASNARKSDPSVPLSLAYTVGLGVQWQAGEKKDYTVGAEILVSGEAKPNISPPEGVTQQPFTLGLAFTLSAF